MAPRRKRKRKIVKKPSTAAAAAAAAAVAGVDSTSGYSTEAVDSTCGYTAELVDGTGGNTGGNSTETVDSTGGNTTETLDSTGGNSAETVDSTCGNTTGLVDSVGRNSAEIVASAGGNSAETVDSTGGNIAEIVDSTGGNIAEIVDSTGGNIVEIVDSTGGNISVPGGNTETADSAGGNTTETVDNTGGITNETVDISVESNGPHDKPELEQFRPTTSTDKTDISINNTQLYHINNEYSELNLRKHSMNNETICEISESAETQTKLTEFESSERNYRARDEVCCRNATDSKNTDNILQNLNILALNDSGLIPARNTGSNDDSNSNEIFMRSTNLDLADGNIKLLISVMKTSEDDSSSSNHHQSMARCKTNPDKIINSQNAINKTEVNCIERGDDKIAVGETLSKSYNKIKQHFPQTFHAPSFGDEEFQIPLILPEDNLSSFSQGSSVAPPVSDSSSYAATCQMLDSSSSSYSESRMNHDDIQPKFPPQNIDIPDITETNYNQNQSVTNTVGTSTYLPMDQSLNSIQNVTSPPGSNQTSPVRAAESGSSDSDDLPLSRLATGLKKAPAAVGRKPKVAPKKRKKKKDPNEPQKPVSAYALFFRDTQAAIKGQNPNATFGEVSKIVASMWDSLAPDSKENYKRRTETAKKEYLQKLAAYRQSPLDVLEKPAAKPVQITNTLSTKTYPLRSSQRAVTNNDMSPVHSSSSSSPAQSLSPIHMSPTQPELSPKLNNDYHGNHVHDSPDHTGRPHNLCTRNGCQNIAVGNTGWDNEYCSNDCVVTHCRDVFTAWVVSRQQSTSNYMQVS
ncbi:uncharacterized protein LOC141901861 isoform X3 [Tubulanus polymorphus]|uniref:uncharacterized protein LOC141901861 isoform X3 n=1 Tax=Tubulanus polymorphus TaxID=672921 RepID=UPI003DA5C290